MILHLIGPGGAGKSTTGVLLASELGISCIDLDQEYLKNSDISADIEVQGYDYYVRRNIDCYIDLINSNENAVMVTSSGFMTYQNSHHESIKSIQANVLECKFTTLLLPSFNEQECIEEIVRRQFTKEHESKSVQDQRERIIKRFPMYLSMGSIKVETNKSIGLVVDEIVNKVNLLTSKCSGSAKADSLI